MRNEQELRDIRQLAWDDEPVAGFVRIRRQSLSNDRILTNPATIHNCSAADREFYRFHMPPAKRCFTCQFASPALQSPQG